MPLLPTDFTLILLKFCTAHLISDYFLQFNSWIADKEKHKIRSLKLYAHIAVTFLAAGIISGEWIVALFIAATHGMIDIIKIYLGKKDSLSFIIDQFFHLIILVISSLWISGDFYQVITFLQSIGNSLQFWAIIFGYLFITFPLSVVITILTHSWRDRIGESYEKLETLNEAAKWIGIMERILVLTFILINQFIAIGFLILARLLLYSRHTKRDFIHYILIEMLLSVTVTILIGLLIKFVSLA